MPEKERESMWACWWADATPRDWRNLRRCMLALAAWALSFVGGAQLLGSGVVDTGPVAWVVAGLPSVLGLLAMVAYGRYLAQADEFQQMIHLRALGIGFGGGWFAIAGYRLFELLGAPAIGRGGIILVMAVLYTAGLLIGLRRYA